MNNETPQPNNVPPANSQEPVNQTPTPAVGFGGGMKVIQPLDPNLKVDTTPTQPPTLPAPATPANPPQAQTINTGIQPIDATTQPTQQRVNPSSIYPEATQGMTATRYQTSSPTDNKKETNESYSFSNGYSIGGSIFWLQLLAVIVLGLILFGIDYFVLKAATVTVIAIVSLLYYLVEFFVVAYIPYNTLKSNNIEEPFWLTTFGVATQSIVVATLFELVISLLIRSVINHGVSSSLAHIGGAGLGAIAIIVYIGFFIASYFLTKLSWGVAFNIFAKITNKVAVKAIGIGVIAIIVGGIGYHYLTLSSKKADQSAIINTSSTSGLASYNVNSSPSFSVDFFKGSVVTTIQGQTVLISSGAGGEQASIYVNTATTPTTSCALSGMPAFSFYVQGIKGLGCYESSGSDGYVQINGQNYDIGLREDFNVSQQTTETIFNSININ